MTGLSSELDLSGLSVAILATDGFEPSELLDPLEALQDAGANAVVVSVPATRETIRGKERPDGAEVVRVDRIVDSATSDDFDALVIPGGKENARRLRESLDAISFVRGFFADRKPVAAICHAPWVIAAAGEAEGRTLTSYPAIRSDLEGAGAEWVDEEVVVDRGLITSRRPADLDAFIEAMREQIAVTAGRGELA